MSYCSYVITATVQAQSAYLATDNAFHHVMNSISRAELSSLWATMRYRALSLSADQHAEHASGQEGT